MSPRRFPARAAATVATLLLLLVSAAEAQAAHVTSLRPWKATNEYLATADIDGRSAPKLEPRAKVDHVRRGQWVRISCQVRGEAAYGSTLWAKVGRYYVPDQLLKTYTDGRLKGAPTCEKPRPRPRCTRYTVLGARGSGESASSFDGMASTVGTAANAIKAKLGRKVALMAVPYPAAKVPSRPEELQPFLQSMDTGQILLAAMIRNRVRDCPRTRIAVIGYSQGAGVVSETLRNLRSDLRRKVRVALLFADTYSAGDTSYADTWSIGISSKPVDRGSGQGILGRKRLPAIPHRYDVCFTDDLVCDGGRGGALALQGAIASIHTKYDEWGPAGLALSIFYGYLAAADLRR